VTLGLVSRVAGALSLLLVAQVLAQKPPKATVVVTNGGYQTAQATVFRHEPGASYRQIWQARPLNHSQASVQPWLREAVVHFSPAMLIADWDQDGTNDLLLLDPLGLTVYGRRPAYLPFPRAADGSHVSLLLADLDADGRQELITQRSAGPDEQQNDTRQLEVWRRNGNSLVRLSAQSFKGVSYGLTAGDVDGDGRIEILTASDTIVILKPVAAYQWQIAAELPNIGLPRRPGVEDAFTLVDVVRIADVDRDGRNEIISSGNSGMVTVHQHRRQRTGRESYPVLWQSPSLAHPELQPTKPGSPPMVLTQGLAVDDFDGDGHADILVGTMESGRPPAGAAGTAHLYLYTFDGQRGFNRSWSSDWTANSGIPAFAVGDLEGDEHPEFLHNGQHLYSFDSGTRSFHSQRLCDESSTAAVIGKLGELAEPTDAVRIVPVRAQFAGGRLLEGKPTQLELTLRSVWAEAKDVQVTVRPMNGTLTVSGRPLRLPLLPAGSLATLPFIMVTAVKPESLGGLPFVHAELEITAAGGYRQTIPWRALVAQGK